MAVGKTAMHVKTIHLRIETQVFAIIILWVGKVDALIVLLPLLATATAGGLALLSTFAHLAPSATLLATFFPASSLTLFSLGAAFSLGARPKDGKDVVDVAATSDATTRSSAEDSVAVDRAVPIPVAPVGDDVLTRSSYNLCIHSY